MKVERLKALIKELSSKPDIAGIDFSTVSGETIFAEIVDSHIRENNDIPQEAEISQIIVESVIFDFNDQTGGSVVISGFATYYIEMEPGRTRDVGEFEFELRFNITKGGSE